MFEVSFEETEYTIHEAGPGESHTALRVCLVQQEGGALSADMGEDGDSLMVDITVSTLDGTATGRAIQMLPKLNEYKSLRIWQCLNSQLHTCS